MAKDVNIHLKTKGAAQTKQDLDQTGKAAKGVGDKTAEGQKKAAPAMEQGTKKLGTMGRVLTTLKTQVMGFVGAWLGLQAVQKLVTYLIQKLERIQELQQTIYEKSLQFMEVGQALETQTGTLGKQQEWAEQAIALQKAGALRGPQVAQQMLVSMDIAFKDRGGIKDPQIRELARQIAPFVGAADLGPQEVSQLIKFAGTAGIAPTEQAYKDYFAQILAAYRASESTIFAQFITGAQKGVTPYIAAGGTLREGLSLYSSAIAVSANEALAATLVEQVSRLSAGGYERPRLAMEEALGVKWSDLTMDQRKAALLDYVGGLPKERSAEILAEQRFPAELTTGIGKLVIPKATRTLESTRQAVAEAVAESVDAMSQSYLDSILAKHRQQEAVIAKREVKAAPEFADWQQRLKDARDQFRYILEKGQDRWAKDSLEPYMIALEQMRQELQAREGEIPTTGPAQQLYRDITKQIDFMDDFVRSYTYPAGMAAKRAYQLSKRLKAIQEQAPEEIEQEPPGPLPTPPPVERIVEAPGVERFRPAQPVGPVSVNYDNRIINYRIVNPLVGINKVDLLIEPPTMSA